jgi:purine catabolism regulatory family protein/PucR-like helix-turn-helix protein/diguanylate cyclase with GGDEF domain
MLTVNALVEEAGVSLLAGRNAGSAPIRWVHISELVDPTPWLSGGELLLTTGIQLSDEGQQRRYVERLVQHSIGGLGFGVGLAHDAVPAAIVDEAQRLDFPLFEVPYEMPFIAITEKAFTRLVNEQYALLQRGITVQRRLEQLVLDERGLDELTRSLSAAIGGSVVLLDGRGEVAASANFRRPIPPPVLASIRAEVANRNSSGRAAAFEPADELIGGRALVLPLAPDVRGGPRPWLVGLRDGGPLGEFERLILQQGVTVVALELMRRRVMRDTERRLAGDILADAVKGELQDHDLQARLRPFGVGGEAAVLVFRLDSPEGGEVVLQRLLSEAGVGALVASREGMLWAVVDGAAGDPLALAARTRAELAREHGDVHVAASRVAATTALRTAYHEARYALEVATFSNGRAPEVASWRDLGAFQLLLSVQDDDALQLYCDSVLGPIEDGEGEYGGELLKSLEAFLEQNGQWEKAARDLFCHRHTLRYRIRRVEQLTGRDLSSARDRIEFWLAIKARELIA